MINVILGFQNFMVDGQTVAEFCNIEVEPMYRESDHIHITALTQLTGVPVQVSEVFYLVLRKYDQSIASLFPMLLFHESTFKKKSILSDYCPIKI